MSCTEEVLLKKYSIHDRRNAEENLQKLQQLQTYLQNISSEEITKLSKELTALEALPRIRLMRLANGIYSNNPGSAAVGSVIIAAIIKAMGYTGLATLGAIAAAAAVGSVVVSMPLAAIWAWYGPTNTSFNPAEWDLKITLLNLIVSAGISILGLAIGSLILNTTMSPALFIGLAVASSIVIFLTITVTGVAKALHNTNEMQEELTMQLVASDISAILARVDQEIFNIGSPPPSDSYLKQQELAGTANRF